MIRKIGRNLAKNFLKIMLYFLKNEYQAWANNYRWQKKRGKPANMEACEMKMEHYAGWILATQHVMPDREPNLDVPEGAFC